MKPEPKSATQTTARTGKAQWETISVQTNGRTIKYAQMISLMLSHSHGAVLTRQAKTKRATAGTTNAKAAETGIVCLQLRWSSAADNGMRRAMTTGGISARATKRP